MDFETAVQKPTISKVRVIRVQPSETNSKNLIQLSDKIMSLICFGLSEDFGFEIFYPFFYV